MHGARVLIAEDDAHIREGLLATLDSEGYRSTAVADGEAALTAFRQQAFDLVLLDIMMPKQSGFDVCRAIRASGKPTAIIMLTAKGEEIDKVVGLQLGADDYVTKPFGVRELLARIEALLRRCRPVEVGRRHSTPLPETFPFGPAVIDARRYQARIGKRTEALTDRELHLIGYFKQHPNEVLSRDELLNAVWGVEYYGTTRTLDQHIARLRRKLRGQVSRQSCIETVHGVGYRYGE